MTKQCVFFGPSLWVGLFVACGDPSGPGEVAPVVGADESSPYDGLNESITGRIRVGTIVEATGDVNLRNAPNTRGTILRVLPKGTRAAISEVDQPTGTFYRVSHSGTLGWVSGRYLKVVSEAVDSGAASGRDATITRARQAVGFSYWWGHGRWRAEGPAASTAGSCTGSCPSCSHSGAYGADCSGLLAKVWQVRPANVAPEVDVHPYSTADFISKSSQWAPVARDALLRGDALVQRSNGSGHAVVFESGDPWGASRVIECRGCADGCVQNTRALSSAFKGMRRTGW